jgi:hypothetical protein
MEGSDLLRKPDWALRTAQSLADSNRFVSPRRFGRSVATTVAFLRAGATSAPAGLELAFRVRYAFPRLAAALEAMVLAGEDGAEIAHHLALTAEAVGWYESVFFDVRDRLDAAGFIVHEVIAGARLLQPTDATGHAWRLIGFLSGPVALRRVMGTVAATNADELVGCRRLGTLDLLEAKLSFAAEALPTDKLGDLVRALRVVHGLIDKADTAQLTDYEENLKAFFEEYSFTIGPRPASDDPLAEFAGGAAELRAEEMLRVAAGETLENAEQIKAMQLPPPRSQREEADP